jgi:hypothetical protein
MKARDFVMCSQQPESAKYGSSCDSGGRRTCFRFYYGGLISSAKSARPHVTNNWFDGAFAGPVFTPNMGGNAAGGMVGQAVRGGGQAVRALARIREEVLLLRLWG